MESSKSPVAKSRVAESFSRAAASYDAAAQLQREVGSELLAMIPETIAGTVVDLGCGTGFLTGALLARRTGDLHVIALDLAPGMLLSTQRACRDAVCVQADMERPPFADGIADALVSSLALQWANDPRQCFRQWRRVLKPDGRLFFSTLLPGTLCELEASWRTVDDAVHVNRFVAREAIVEALRSAGFGRVESRPLRHTVFCPQLHDLARGLKAIGAHNMNSGQPRGLTGRRRWARLQSAYEALRTERGLPATYEVLYVSAA